MMEFPDFHHTNDTKPFPTQADILQFLHSYADHFDLNEHIKLNHLVVRVLPVENDKWEIIVRDLPTNQYYTEIFDAVFVCNGHYFAPQIPQIDGANEFKGKILHSHDFRKADAFQGNSLYFHFSFLLLSLFSIFYDAIKKTKLTGENVLVIGTGPSGVDLVIHLSNVAKRVTISRNKPPKETREARQRRESALPPKTILKDNVRRLTADGAEFIDGTIEKFTTIIYATGDFNYSFDDSFNCFISLTIFLFIEL